MIVRNYLDTEYKLESSHAGQGQVKNVRLFEAEDFDTKLRFIYYLEMEPNTSIGYHQHGHNEEAYVVLEGQGLMTVNGEARAVKTGDVILNKPGWSHGLENTSGQVLKLLVFEVTQ
ncbi:MAG: cupin domain-containing protein [Anaerolineae bacterium]|nr:cupin domain-containing protein [Anaerolineae bacterium]